MSDLQKAVKAVFYENFGRTPLRQRVDDIMGETLELVRFTDLANLKEELGDLMASCIQMANENGWDYEELVAATLTKIERRRKQYGSLGRKTKVAILGGAFDPIHIGHIRVAQFVLNTSKTFDEVWLVPCYQHLYGKKMVSSDHRLEMCKIASSVDGRINVFNYEIKNKLAGETYHFVKQLLEEQYAKDEYDFSMIIGQDNANTFDKWVNYEDLERMIRFIVVPRHGVDVNPASDWYFKPPHIYLEPDSTLVEVSSTAVREMLAKWWDTADTEQRDHLTEKVHVETNDWLNKQVDPNVLEYIERNNLYNGRA